MEQEEKNTQRPTIYQRLNKLFGTDTPVQTDYSHPKQTSTYSLDGQNILYQTPNREDYIEKKKEMMQYASLAKGFRKASLIKSLNEIQNQTEIQMMYRDAELMDGFPEIGTAMDIMMEDACCVGPTGAMIEVQSKSKRIKSVLEDLLNNRLSINTTLPLICRDMLKYGNTFMLHNISRDNGIVGWIQLPAMEMFRLENGMLAPYSALVPVGLNANEAKDQSTMFEWVGANCPRERYFNWQVSHFRLLYETTHLPYGTSFLNKARHHWRMLSQMEDMMLMYRLERSVERRIFKVYVGSIAEEDVPAYMDEVANQYKRTPIVDPATGQLDLRKSVLSVSDDFYIPVRSSDDPSEITSLSGAQNLTAMDDIKYVQKKICAALRVPMSYLNFEEEKGDGKNLSVLDVRFAKTVNRVQQCLLMELNKICVIHLWLLGFADEITNFNLSMHNPSLQATMLELENIEKKVNLANAAITPQGENLPLMSMAFAWKHIMGWSDEQIKENYENMRFEKAAYQELQNTPAIIKKTGVYDAVDNILGSHDGDAGAAASGEAGAGDAAAGGGAMGGTMGGDMDAAAGDMTGAEGEMDMDAAAADAGAAPLNEETHAYLKRLDEWMRDMSDEKSAVNEDVDTSIDAIEDMAKQ